MKRPDIVLSIDELVLDGVAGASGADAARVGAALERELFRLLGGLDRASFGGPPRRAAVDGGEVPGAGGPEALGRAVAAAVAARVGAK
jgi:hypothetical protein